LKSIVFFTEITNAEFHCGKAEEVLPWLIRRYGDKDVVAVVDPPRAGLR
jgi:tRNA (uracil-5-)-methyltransferase